MLNGRMMHCQCHPVEQIFFITPAGTISQGVAASLAAKSITIVWTRVFFSSLAQVARTREWYSLRGVRRLLLVALLCDRTFLKLRKGLRLFRPLYQNSAPTPDRDERLECFDMTATTSERLLSGADVTSDSTPFTTNLPQTNTDIFKKLRPDATLHSFNLFQVIVEADAVDKRASSRSPDLRLY